LGKFVNGLVFDILELLLGNVLLGEISKGTMGVLGSVLIFPRLIRLVVLLADDSLELVLT
jgi:hypothetical protein